MINNVLGQLEFHATVFTAAKGLPTATLMDALNFAQFPIGTSINVNTSIRTINAIPAPMRFYNSSFAGQFHTYKIVRLQFGARALLCMQAGSADRCRCARAPQVWTTNSVAWMVDTGAALRVRLRSVRPCTARMPALL
jgi:hypothetical protein